MRTLCIGDVHGSHKALIQVLARCDFNPEKDKLISLGDICDGYPEVDKCIDYLIELPNKVLVRGNHDEWTVESLKRGSCDSIHYNQGGKHTMSCYMKNDSVDREKVDRHIELFFNKQKHYHEENNMLFVHGGFDPFKPIEEQEPHELMWDRDLTRAGLHAARSNPDAKFPKYDKIFIGHTPTLNWNNKSNPIVAGGVVNLDTGAGYGYKLTVMDVNTLEYWQSDYVEDLYPGFNPRG